MIREKKVVSVDPTFIAKRITELRLSRGISEYQLSLELGQSRSYIQGITSGKNMPSVKQLFNIADYFDVTMAEFFGENLFEEALTPSQIEAIHAIAALGDKDVKLLLEIIDRFIIGPRST